MRIEVARALRTGNLGRGDMAVLCGCSFIFHQPVILTLPSPTPQLVCPWLLSSHSHPDFKELRLEQRFLTRGEFAPWGQLSTDLFGCLNGSRWYWYLVGEDQGGCKTPYDAQAAPHNKE